MINFVLTLSAEKELKKLPHNLQKRIIKKLQFFASQKDPFIFSKPLVNLPPSTHRFRVGDYRIAFYLKDKNLVIQKIEHRKNVYR